MARSSASTGETLLVAKELKEIFSNNYREKEKLKVLISDIEFAQYLFSQLPDVIIKYEQLGENIDQEINFLNQLKKFQILIEDNIKKSSQNHNILLIIDDYLSAIREDYKLIRNYVQTLEEINIEIEKYILNGKNKNKIGNLIVRGVEEKIPNLIYFNQKNSNDIKKKSEIVKKFYDYFIKYISFVREALENMLNDSNYRLKLENLQTKLLKTAEPIDIDDYFSKIKLKIINDKGYSTEILLESLAKNLIVHRRVANNSKFYRDSFIEIFENSNDKKCIESLTKLIFQLDNLNFIELNKQIFQKKLSINLIFKPIYDIGIELYLNECSINLTSTKDKIINYFKPTTSKNLKRLREKFKNLFEMISSEKSDMLSVLKSLVIDEKNSNGTYILLTDIYGQRIKNLDFSDDIINVKYCFNYYFFKSLNYQDLDDVNGFSIFVRLLFYIHTYNHNYELNYKNKNDHKQDILNLKNNFLEHYNDDNHANFNDLVEIFKVMINIQSFKFRLNCAESIISELENNENLNVKVEVLKKFLDDEIDGNEICLRLAQSFNIYLIKDIDDDKNKILSKLCDYNPNFKSVIEHLNDLKIKFDIDNELTPGFSIPYYLSAKSIHDKKYVSKNNDYNKKNNEIVMSILFKVFTSSTDRDKEEFLQNKNDINKEFVKLFESVNRLIEFYKNDNEINKKLRDKSIQYILNGFTGTTDESLKQKNEYARIIIDNFINYKLEYIDTIVKSSTENEILNLFNAIMQRKDNDTLRDWTENTSKLGDKVYFSYCYHQYKEKEFDQWYQGLNSNLSYKIIECERDSIKQDFLTNSKAFDLINIKYLQHNQVGALALINYYLKDHSKANDNLFIKIDTGQGKSLIIAETARKIIQMNKNTTGVKQKIFVITCYDHLAKRDHENYHKYYKYFDIKSMYCSSISSTKDFYDKDVIYSDLETYFSVLRKEGFNTLNEGTSIDLPDISNSVLIMDEFDSLILDSDELLQYVQYFDLKINNIKTNFDKKEDIEQLFDKKFIDKCNKKFDNVFDRWWEYILLNKQKEDKNENIKSVQDSLGKDSTFAESFLNYLKRTGKATFIHFYLDALVFYSKFKQVIGFSGSMTENGMNKFQKLFKDKKSSYYEIPPFFGPTKLISNRTFVNKPGKIIENRDEFLRSIRDEVKRRYEEQPILIFADSFKKQTEDKSDYDYIYDKLLEAKNTFLKDCTIILIKTEKDINENIHKIGKLGSITLATRIIGRGADIKVDKNVEKGLHLILTYYPEKENIYTQMLGRTARQDEKGSYSEIVRQEKNFAEIHEITVNSRNKQIHEITEHFYKTFHPSSSNKDVALKWPLFSSLMLTLNSKQVEQYDLINFVEKEIL